MAHLKPTKTLPRSYKCPACGQENEFTGWVFAHWNEKLTHQCECGATNDIKSGVLLESRSPKKVT